MPGLIPDVSCDEPDPPTSCTALFDLGEWIMLAALDALEPFEVDGCGDGAAGYVSMAEPRVAVEDLAGGALVSPWLVSYGFGPSTEREMLGNSGRIAPVFTAVWRVEFREAEYPLDQGETQPNPVPLDQLHEIHRHIYAHGLAVFSAVTGAYFAKTLVPDPFQCPRMSFTRMTPIAPSGIVVGWRFDVTAEL